MRIEQLTFTQFVAALAIVVFHDDLDVFPFHLPGLQSVFQNAYAGVSYFFILSGFVMAVAYSRKGVEALSYRTFYIHRFARIYPAYFMALMMVVFLFLVSGKGVEIVSFMSSLFLIQAWIPGHAATLNNPGLNIHNGLLAVFIVPFIVCFSYGSYRFIEQPFRRMIQWRLKPRLVLHPPNVTIQ